jgi:hypothetical protein
MNRDEKPEASSLPSPDGFTGCNSVSVGNKPSAFDCLELDLQGVESCNFDDCGYRPKCSIWQASDHGVVRR